MDKINRLADNLAPASGEPDDPAADDDENDTAEPPV